MSEQTHYHVIVIGTGFVGLGMAIRLRQQAMTDFVVLERAAEVGGTWGQTAIRVAPAMCPPTCTRSP